MTAPHRAAIDLRGEIADGTGGPWHVVIAARQHAESKSLFGHSWIAIFGADQMTKQSVRLAIGLYPARANGKESQDGERPTFTGELRDEYVTASTAHATHLLRVRMTEAQMQAVLGLVDEHLDRKRRGELRYRLLDADCMTFVQDIVHQINRQAVIDGTPVLHMPDRTRLSLPLLPQAWTAAIIEANITTGVPEPMPERFF